MTTNTTLRFAGVLGALCIAGTGLSAQTGLSPNASSGPQGTSQSGLLGQAQTSYTQLIGHAVEDGTLWVAGDRYKARYLGGGVEFTPALGVTAPHNMPWTYTFQTMERGSVQLAQAGSDTALQWQGEDHTVRTSRARGIDEVHHVRANGLEITYVLASQPAGSGDLVVTASVDSELWAPAGDYGQGGIDFRLKGIGGVHVSGVVGVDAAGRRTKGSIGWDGEHITFSLPGSFLDDASYPVVLDPVIGSSTAVGLSTSTQNDTKPDIAFDLTNDVYAVCWQRVFSANNSQIRAALLDGTSYSPISPQLIAVSPNGSGVFREKPAIANNNFSNQFLIVWAESTNVFAPRDVYCRTLRPDGSLSANSVALATGTADQFEPDVGGDARGFDDDCVVVWTDASQGIRSTQVATPATTDPFKQGEQALTFTASDRQPAVSKTMLTSRTLAVWRNSAGTIQGRFMSNNAIPLGTEADISDSVLNDSNPDVDGDGTVWLVVWEQLTSNAGILTDIFCRRVNLVSSANLSFPEPEAGLGVVGTNPNENERDPSVSIHNIRFVVCYEDDRSFSAGTSDIAVAYIGRDVCRECQNRNLIQGTNTTKSVLPAVCSRRSGGDPDSDRGAIIWSDTDLTPPFDGDAYVRGVQSAGNGGILTNTGGACGAAGVASVGNGPGGVLGNLETTVELTGASITAPFAFLWGAVAGQPRIACGPCRALDPGLLSINIGTPVNLGTASVRVPTPCNPVLNGLSVEFQFIVFETATNDCPLIPGLGVTDIMRITLTQ